MAHTVLRNITDNIRDNRYYSIIVDEAMEKNKSIFAFVMYQVMWKYMKTF